MMPFYVMMGIMAVIILISLLSTDLGEKVAGILLSGLNVGLNVLFLLFPIGFMIWMFIYVWTDKNED